MCREEELPRRPAIPAALYALLALTLCQRHVLQQGEDWLAKPVTYTTAIVVVALLVCIVAALRLGHRIAGTVLVVLVCMAVGVVLSSLTLNKGVRCVEHLRSTGIAKLSFHIQSEPIRRTASYRCRATAYDDGGELGDVWLLLPSGVPLASTIRCVGRFVPNPDNEWGASSRMQGIWGTVHASYILEQHQPRGLLGVVGRLRQAVLDSLEPGASETRALLAGCTCGVREDLVAFGLDRRFSTCGISHLIAVSGSHMSILSTLVVLAMDTLAIRRPQRVALLIATGGLFVLFCGAPVSAVRSWAMTCSALIAGVAGRRAHALSGVSLAGLAMELLDPAVSGQTGFLLSVSSVAGLCIFSPYASYVLHVLVGTPRLPRFIPRRLGIRIHKAVDAAFSALGASLVAQVATLPVATQTFDEVSVVGPLANTAIMMPFTLLVGVGMLACACCGIPPLQTGLLAICDTLSAFVLWVLGVFEELPFATVSVRDESGHVPLAVMFLGIALLVVWPRVSKKRLGIVCATVATVVCAVFVRWRYLAPARLCVLDVGQGDAILVQEGASTLLVDTGPDESIAAALARNHVVHVDAVLITHLHEDHYAGLASLRGRVSCDHVYVAQGVAVNAPSELAACCKELTGKSIEEVSYGDVLRIDGFRARVVWPRTEVAGDQNADSVELVLSYATQDRTLDALLTGDAEKDETAAVVANGDVGDIDVLKVGHHGSEVSIAPNDAEALDPEVSVASAGEGNSYGHPAPECVRTLEDAGSLFLCTKDMGDVEVRPGTKGPELFCQRRGGQ